MRGRQVKLCDPLTTSAIPQRFRNEVALYRGAISISVLYLPFKRLVKQHEIKKYIFTLDPLLPVLAASGCIKDRCCIGW